MLTAAVMAMIFFICSVLSWSCQPLCRSSCCTHRGPAQPQLRPDDTCRRTGRARRSAERTLAGIGIREAIRQLSPACLPSVRSASRPGRDGAPSSLPACAAQLLGAPIAPIHRPHPPVGFCGTPGHFPVSGSVPCPSPRTAPWLGTESPGGARRHLLRLRLGPAPRRDRTRPVCLGDTLARTLLPVTPSHTRRCARLSPGPPARRSFSDLAVTLPRRGFLPLDRRRTSVSPADPPAPGSRPGWLGVLCGPLHQLRSGCLGAEALDCWSGVSVAAHFGRWASCGVRAGLSTRKREIPIEIPSISEKSPSGAQLCTERSQLSVARGAADRVPGWPIQASQWPRSIITWRNTEGRSVMMPSTPMSRRRCISAGSSMVQT